MLDNFYDKRFKSYMAIALAVLFVMAFFAFVTPQVQKGIDLSGGTILIARTDKPVDSKALSDELSSKFDFVDLAVSSISSPTGYGVTIKFAYEKQLFAAEAEIIAAKTVLKTNPAEAQTRAENALQLLEKFVGKIPPENSPGAIVTSADIAFTNAKEKMLNDIQQAMIQKFSLTDTTAFQIKEVSPTLGASFWQTAMTLVIIVLILIVLVVFFFFRELVPSVVVISCGLFDAVFCLGAMSLTGITLSLSTIPALLMLMGYSIDTDVMVASRILKRKEATPAKRAGSSMLTGFTMTGTTIVAILVMVILSYAYQVDTIFEIGAVLLLGLIGDLVGTWLWSAPVLLWAAERKEKAIEKRFK